MVERIFLLLGTPGGWRVVGKAGQLHVPPIREGEAPAEPGPARKIAARQEPRPPIDPRAPDYSNEDVEVSVEAPGDEVASRAAEVLEKKGYRGEGILIALPSSWCFSASVQTGDLPRNDRKAMAYRLEEKLPVAAEAVVADFVVRQGGEGLGVSAKLDPMKALIDALEGRGVAVQSVVPAALLSAQGVEAGASENPVFLLLSNPIFGSDVVEIVTLEGGQPSHWATVPAARGDVQLHLDMLSMSLSGKPRVETLGVGAEIAAALGRYSSEVKSREEDVVTLMVSAAGEMLGGRRRAWVEFRRGALAVGDRLRLYRKQLNAALAAGVALMLGLSAAMFARERRYVGVETTANQQVVDAFREQFPGWEVPANVRAVIDSEHRKAAMASTASGAPGLKGRSAVETFKGVLAQLPTEGKTSIRKMTFEDSAFEVEGLVKSYEQLDGIVAAARKAGMEVPAPESRKNAEGYWDFTLHGALPEGQGQGGQKSADEVAKGGGE